MAKGVASGVASVVSVPEIVATFAGVGVSSGVAETVCFGAASVGAASACTTRPVIMYLRPKVQNAITMPTQSRKVINLCHTIFGFFFFPCGVYLVSAISSFLLRFLFHRYS